MKKKRSQLLFFILSLILGACTTIAEKADKQNEKKPNIIFIMSDDHAVKAISSYGSSINNTPNIDRLADEGMRFDHGFCTNAICAPSRAVLLTGKYSHINGQIDNSNSFDGSQQTFPKLMQQHNYQTALIGKWHLRSEPTGFDYWIILPGQGSYYNPDFIEMGERKRLEGYVTDLITDFTIDWLDNRDTTKPFCLLMHHKASHRSWMPGPDYLNAFDSAHIPLPETFFDDYQSRVAAESQKMSIWKDMLPGYDLKLTKAHNSTEIIDDDGTWAFDRMTPEQRVLWDSAYLNRNNEYHINPPKGKQLAEWKYNRYMQDYLGTIESVDESVGRVLDYLEENGLSENTIVVYTSDQGFFLGEHGWFDKRFMYEESLQIPLLIKYPNEIPKGKVSQQMVLNLDFAPTFLDYAGIPIPEEMQGVSLREVLNGEEPADWRDGIYYHYFEYPKGGHDVKRHYGIRTEDYKLIHYYFDIDEWELFDLQNDPDELNNLYNNLEYIHVVDSLTEKLNGLQQKYHDNDYEKFLPGKCFDTVFHIGVDAEVTLANPFSPKYSGGSKNALSDGKVSVGDVSQVSDFGVWQGFEGVDIDAVVDLGKETEITSVSIGFLHNTNAWIFSPEWVEFYVSADNHTYNSLGKVDRMLPIKSGKEINLEYKIEANGLPARFIRVHTKNIGLCPDWHVGHGKKAWLFADEIVIE